MADVSELEQELKSINSELQAVEIQVQELLERQQVLLQNKSVLKKKIKQLSEDAEEGASLGNDLAETWNKEDFPWSQKVKDALNSVFKLDKFRSLQLESINVTMSGKDIFLVMPTGGGKSLCYQLPAVCSDGFTLVICPLVSLMEDQLMVLEQLGVSATSLNASSSKEHVKWVHNEMIDKSSKLKLIYVTPEKIAKSKMFMSKLEKAHEAGRLTRIAVDEVHCCSQWGHDFRPDYKLLGILKRLFPSASLIGLTATATSNILKDVQNILYVKKCITFTASFNRPNLFYEVTSRKWYSRKYYLQLSGYPGKQDQVRAKPSNNEDFIEDIVKVINGRYKGQSGIIYCFSQKDSEQITMSLQKLGIKAGAYHANMESTDKSRVHKLWTTNDIQVVVATVAFGMGIDKADVRFVIHHSMSKSMENYYQESGRAGRDDKKADCILYYGFGDIYRVSSMVVMENVGQKKLYEMVSYCLNWNRCRRILIAQHFDEVWDSANCNKMCDNCCREKLFEKIDITGYCKDLVKILQQAEKMEEKLTPLKLIDAWLGKGPSKLRVASVAPPKLKRDEMERVIVHLLLDSYLREDFSFTAYATISYLKTGPKVDLLKNEKHAIRMEMKKRKSSHSTDPQMSPVVSDGEKSDNGVQLEDHEASEKSIKKVEGELKRPAKKCNFHAKKSKVENEKAADAAVLIE